MKTNVDIWRLRHVARFGAAFDAEGWSDFKRGIDAIGGLLTQSGLVQALVVALGAGGDNAKNTRNATEALQSWLTSEHSPVQALCGEAKTVPADFVVAMMAVDSPARAMAIQAEAIRYLGQAKLLARAMARTPVEDKPDGAGRGQAHRPRSEDRER